MLVLFSLLALSIVGASIPHGTVVAHLGPVACDGAALPGSRSACSVVAALLAGWRSPGVEDGPQCSDLERVTLRRTDPELLTLGQRWCSCG
jgi:hypothetical protein